MGLKRRRSRFTLRLIPDVLSDQFYEHPSVDGLTQIIVTASLQTFFTIVEHCARR